MSHLVFHQVYLHDHSSLLRAEPSQPNPTLDQPVKPTCTRSLSLGPRLGNFGFVAQRGVTYNINELGDGQPEAHEHHVRDVGHGTGPFVVAREEFLQEPLLGVGSGLHMAKGCGEGMKHLQVRGLA